MILKNLRPVEHLSQVDKIEMSLRDFLRKGNFLPGDSLPKEIELAEAMGVSRTALREALSRFRTLGIIEARKNRGMVMVSPDFLNNMERVLDPQLLDDETMQEIFEMRLVIEVGLADILFLRKNDEDLVKLEKIIDLEEKSIKKIDLVKYDIEFHSMLYKLSGNTTILRFQKMLKPVFDHVYTKLDEDNALYTGNIPEGVSPITHRDLLNSLREGTVEEFRSQMYTHLMVYFKKISK